MKKILFIVALATLSACGPHMYSTRSNGRDNQAYVIVLSNGGKYSRISLDVDGTVTPIETIYKVKAARKAHPVVITPGKHVISVLQNGREMTHENVYIGLQETKKIVLK